MRRGSWSGSRFPLHVPCKSIRDWNGRQLPSNRKKTEYDRKRTPAKDRLVKQISRENVALREMAKGRPVASCEVSFVSAGVSFVSAGISHRPGRMSV